MPNRSGAPDTRKGTPKRARKGRPRKAKQGTGANEQGAGRRPAVVQEDTLEPLIAAWRVAKGREQKNRAAFALRVELARQGRSASEWVELMGRI